MVMCQFLLQLLAHRPRIPVIQAIYWLVEKQESARQTQCGVTPLHLAKVQHLSRIWYNSGSLPFDDTDVSVGELNTLKLHLSTIPLERMLI